MQRKHDKINQSLGGIREMDKVPGAIFIVDTQKEDIAVREAKKLNIPIIGMVDTNCDPDDIDYVIPANDDAIRAIHLISDVMANAVIEGRQSVSEGQDVVEEETGKKEVEDNTEEAVVEEVIEKTVS